MYGIRISQQCKIGTYYDFQIEFGVIDGYRAAIKQFHRSVNRDQISFTCGGWCSLCGPISRPIKFQRSMEFSEFETVLFVFSKKKYSTSHFNCFSNIFLVSAAEAQAVICKK